MIENISSGGKVKISFSKPINWAVFKTGNKFLEGKKKTKLFLTNVASAMKFKIIPNDSYANGKEDNFKFEWKINKISNANVEI